jgi:hypothetical protein
MISTLIQWRHEFATRNLRFALPVGLYGIKSIDTTGPRFAKGEVNHGQDTRH